MALSPVDIPCMLGWAESLTPRLGHPGHLEGTHAHTGAGKYVGPAQRDHCDQCDHHHEAIASEHRLQIESDCHQIISALAGEWEAAAGLIEVQT